MKTEDFVIDLERLENLCLKFSATLKPNRKIYNDGGIALLVLEDVKRTGVPSEQHKKRLLDWCYTNGPVFQKGVGLAREICIAIYGELLPDPDND